MERLRNLGYFFAHNQRALPWCLSTYVGHRGGFIFGYPGRSKYPPTYDPRKRPWYNKAAEKGRLTWTDLYLDRNQKDMVMTCANPVYEQNGKLVAVAAIDVMLTQILKHIFKLEGLHVSDAMLTDGVEDSNRVIVSRAYRKASTAKVSASSLVKLTRIDQYEDRQFREVFARIREKIKKTKKKKKRSGIIPMTGGNGNGKAGSAGSEGGAIYTYATVPIRELSYENKGIVNNWYYVVKTPIDHIVAPVKGIRKVHKESQEEMTVTIQAKVERLWFHILVISLGVLVLSLVAAYLAARSSTRPLVHMAEVAQKVGKGDLEQKVEIKSKDEVGQLGNAINEMVTGLKERDFIRDTFKQYVAASVVDELLQNPDKIKLGGERRVMSVFFSDVAGFTTLSETLQAEELISLINEYLGAMTSAIFEHEGTLDKYIGDAIMAFWGAPQEQEDHALRACKAALDNRKNLKKLWDEWEKRGVPRLEMRIGLNTGPMVVGNTGSEHLQNYTVLGDAVNLGSRLEGANKAFGTHILISEQTRKAAGDAIAVREVDLIAVKGKSQAVRVFELLGLTDEMSEEDLAGYRTFEAALQAYKKQDWDEAEAKFRKASEVLGGDRASEVFLGRIELFRKDPPDDGWDGTFTMKAK
jgi:class 3 adenylate cyclase